MEGEGTHARIRATSRAAYRAGVRLGMHPTRARALVADLRLLPYDEGLLEAASLSLVALIQEWSPRVSTAGFGCFWMETFTTQDGSEPGWAEQLARALLNRGFETRIGVADCVVTASAASRTASQRRATIVPEGQGPLFLKPLPLRVLPLNRDLQALLLSVGIRCVGELQDLSLASVERRFGTLGVRAWQLAWAKDTRAPHSPRSSPDMTLSIPLQEPSASTTTLLFLLKGAFHQLARGLLAAKRAITKCQIVLVCDDQTRRTLAISPSRPTPHASILFELARIRLEELTGLGSSQSRVSEIVLEVVAFAPWTPRQGELWSHRSHDPVGRESAFLRLRSRFGTVPLAYPHIEDTQDPDASSQWRQRRPLATPTLTRPTHPSTHLPACMSLLNPPRELTLPEASHALTAIIFDSLPEFKKVQIKTWSDPEFLSGHWWSTPYERVYYWVSTSDGRLFWLFWDLQSDAWFLHGWLD